MDLHPHRHILGRLQEYAPNKLNPEYGVADQTGQGDSSTTATSTKKEGDEFKPTGEERREVELADKILTAAEKMASTPDVEEIIRYADELKKMHGVTEGDVEQQDPLIDAWNRLTGLLQNVNSLEVGEDAFRQLHQWWDRGDSIIRRLIRHKP
jgi:hypothetical protein